MNEIAEEEALGRFIAALPEGVSVHARSLAHAWTSGGGSLQVGKISARLTASDPPFTAAVIHAPHGEQPPHIEFSRVLLEGHGVAHEAWVHWSDEFADLAHHDLDPAAKFPRLRLDAELSAAEIARLATGLRDLAGMIEGPERQVL